jgi:hypothetical protein
LASSTAVLVSSSKSLSVIKASENAVVLASEEKAFSELIGAKTKLGEVSAEIRAKITNQKPNEEVFKLVEESI